MRLLAYDFAAVLIVALALSGSTMIALTAIGAVQWP